MLQRIEDLVNRARNKATTQFSFAAHRAYRWYARRRLHLGGQSEAAKLADAIRHTGYALIPPDSRIHEFVATSYVEMAAAWTANDRVWRDPPSGGTYKVFLSDVCERWPAALDLLAGAPTAMLEAYYGSHFRYSYVEPYRTFPRDGELPKSWLWHQDAVPPGVLKLMIYLNGA